MREVLQFPEELSVERTSMIMFRTPLPSWDEEQVMQMAEMFGVHGEVEDAGFSFVVRDERAELEVFHASDSLWWTDLTATAEEPREPADLLEEGEAVEQAEAFLQEHELHDERARVKSVTYTEFGRIIEGQKEPETFRIAQHVNFEFLLDELPIMGGGAKMRVTFGSGGDIIEVYKFWREPVEDRVMDIIRPEVAVRLLRQDPSFAQLPDGEARVVFHRAWLGYFAWPAPERQGYLVPVYAFEGMASTPALERDDFVKYVVAVHVSPEEIKEARAVFQDAALVF